ncbi:excalibur calcium-binding domain-containing protein [Marinobacter psychrophilus]|jgi:hypothetical protein|uniref:excalibur calcium-binding domain-containing protein n=1 Tax=Marinobacter psychrophilus TaxID=330734 RepID=UPI000A0207AB|nr:excalibur calcium-binding domain-containing protein [Marinobacter psychrophilus]
MNKIIILAVVLAVGWYGNFLYKQNDLPFIQNSATYFGSGEQVKCITKDGKVLYGSVPQGTICERREPVEGSLTIVSSESFSSNKDNIHSGSSFKCDGRQHCSQMNSRAEAVYFVKNCSNTKMDGDHDGVPCENDSRF